MLHLSHLIVVSRFVLSIFCTTKKIPFQGLILVAIYSSFIFQFIFMIQTHYPYHKGNQ